VVRAIRVAPDLRRAFNLHDKVALYDATGARAALRKAERRLPPLFDDAGRLVLLEEGRGLVTIGPDGKDLGPPVPLTEPTDLALGDAGAVYVATRSGLARVVDGAVAWRSDEACWLEDVLVTDREGVAYVGVSVRDRPPKYGAVRARGADGGLLFEVPCGQAPQLLAIDLAGRLLVKDDVDLIAIA
jgi:hypothetical protein